MEMLTIVSPNFQQFLEEFAVSLSPSELREFNPPRKTKARLNCSLVLKQTSSSRIVKTFCALDKLWFFFVSKTQCHECCVGTQGLDDHLYRPTPVCRSAQLLLISNCLSSLQNGEKDSQRWASVRPEPLQLPHFFWFAVKLSPEDF